jgi:signal peptidase I
MSLKTEAKPSLMGGQSDTLKVIVHALILAMIVRIVLFQPFNIPSGSMKATLLIGDYLFVSKYSYGYSTHSFPHRIEFAPLGFKISIPVLPKIFSGRIFSSPPKRGDVAVFKWPRDNDTDYIKRVIGLPGDEVQMKDGVLFIKQAGEQQWYEVPKRRIADWEANDDGRVARYEEILPNGVKYNVLDLTRSGDWDNTGVYKVPQGHYFMMGDNRDNSNDSRNQNPLSGGVGFVPLENFVGKAQIIFYSADYAADDTYVLLKPWLWPGHTRWSRILKLVR